VGTNGATVTVLFPAQLGTGHVDIRCTVHRTHPSASFIWPAYAIVSHRFQGGESETVILTLDHKQQRMATQNILYTAFTRFRRHLIILSPVEPIEACLDPTAASTITTTPTPSPDAAARPPPPLFSVAELARHLWLDPILACPLPQSLLCDQL
jgi:hypothetical protein